MCFPNYQLTDAEVLKGFHQCRAEAAGLPSQCPGWDCDPDPGLAWDGCYTCPHINIMAFRAGCQ